MSSNVDAAGVLGSIRGSIARPVVENEHFAASPEKILRPQYHRTHHRGTEAASARDFGRGPRRPHSEYFAAELHAAGKETQQRHAAGKETQAGGPENTQPSTCGGQTAKRRT